MALPSTPLPESRRRASRRLRYGYPFALAVLVLSIVLVVLAWSHARQRELRLASEQFRHAAGQQASLVQMHMNNIELTLRGGASLFAAVGHPDPRQWRGYVDGLQLEARFPSLLGVGYAMYVDGGGLARLQESWRAEGRGLLEVRPRGVRAEYAPVIYMEPLTPPNLRGIGFDMFSEATRRDALRAAMEEGQPRLSGSLVLQRDLRNPARSLVLYTAVYDRLFVGDSPHARRQAMRGWVFAPFRVDDMLRVALAPSMGSSGTLLRVVDTTDPRHVVLHQDAGIEAHRHAFTHSLTMGFYGRRWRFDFFSGPAEIAAPQLASLDNLLAAGIAGAFLLFALAWMLASTEARAQRIAEGLTESYRRSEQRFRNALRYSGIGKALLDSSGAIVDINPAFARIVGRSLPALVGRTLNSLLEEGGSSPLNTAQMQAFDEDGGVVRLTRSLRRGDGETRHVHLTFAPVPNEPGVDVARLVQVEDVTPRVHAEAALQSLNRTLEARVEARTRQLSEANRELESFAYSMSHDLRAPLRGIEGFSRMLGERYGDALDETGRDYLARVRKATARMGELIDGLLTLARIGRIEISAEDVDVSALAQDILAGLADADPARTVEARVLPGMHAWVDPAMLRNLLENLLGNAWKFTSARADACIEVGQVRREDGRDWYFVRDNGAGFDPEYANKLFKPFQRLHNQDEFPGHGIGLASVKRILERHGAEIEAAGSPGQGAIFSFTLAGSRAVAGP